MATDIKNNDKDTTVKDSPPTTTQSKEGREAHKKQEKDSTEKPYQKTKQNRGGSRGKRSRSGGRQRRKSEYDQKILQVRRVVRVVAGGRRFSLSVTVAIGDKQGRVSVGVGKGSDVARALDKAVTQAKKHLTTVLITDNGSIPHDVQAKYCSSHVYLAPSSGGIIAGGAVRTVADLAGIRNINGKILSRSKNHLNNARAAIKALSLLKK